MNQERLFETPRVDAAPQADKALWARLSRARASFEMRSETLARHEDSLQAAKFRNDYPMQVKYERKVHHARLRVREIRAVISELEEQLFGEWAPQGDLTPEQQRRIRDGWGVD